METRIPDNSGIPITETDLILKPDQEVSESFSVDGKSQILCKMPPGEDWGNPGDRVVTLEALDPGPETITEYNSEVEAPNTAYLDNSSDFTPTGDDFFTVDADAGGNLLLTVDRDLSNGLDIDFGALGELLSGFMVQNNTGDIMSIPDTRLLLGEVLHNDRYVGTWIRQRNTDEGVDFGYETDTNTTDLTPFPMTFQDAYYADENQINLASGTLLFQFDATDTDQDEIVLDARTTFDGFRISADPSNAWTFRNSSGSSASFTYTTMEVLVDGNLVGDLLVGSQPILIPGNSTRNITFSDDDFQELTYIGDITASSEITIRMHQGVDSDVDINFNGFVITVTPFTINPTGAVDSDIVFQNENYAGDDSYDLTNNEALAFNVVDTGDAFLQVEALADMTNVRLRATFGDTWTVTNNSGFDNRTGTFERMGVTSGGTSIGNLIASYTSTFFRNRTLNNGFFFNILADDLTFQDIVINSVDEGDVISIDTDFDMFDVNFNGLRIEISADDIPGTVETENTFTFTTEDLDLEINQNINIPFLEDGDTVKVNFRLHSFDEDDIYFQFGRNLDIALHAEHSSGEDWFEVEDPVTRDTVIYWDGPGFQEIEGAAGILYRLRTTLAGCRASQHLVRSWVSSRPGR